MTAVNYLWNPLNDNVVREFDDAGNTLAEYTAEPDLYGNVVSQYRDGQTSFLHSDGQGNTTEPTNDLGNVTDTIRYSAFGEVTERTGSTEIPFQYVGLKGYYRDDESGQYSIRVRPLSPSQGRWIATDPLAMIESVLRAYIYALNDPISRFDPSGLEDVSCGAEPAPMTCCCCVEGLTIPKNLIKPSNSVVIPVPGNPTPPPTPQWGMEFTVVVETQWKPHPEKKDCVLQWCEWMQIPHKGQKPRVWIDQFDVQPGSSTFDGWTKKRRMPCPGKETANITDPPGLLTGNPRQSGTQNIYFAIKVLSAPDCPCEEPFKIVFAQGHFEIDKGIGKSPRWLKEIPKLPGHLKKDKKCNPR